MRSKGSAAGLAMLVWAAAASGASGAGAPSRSAFLVSISGAQTTVVVRERAATNETGCTTLQSGVEKRRFRFASQRAVRARLSSAGLAAVTVPVDVLVAGEATEVASYDPPGCGNVLPARRRTCRPSTVAGRVAVRRVGAARIQVAGSLARRRDDARCALAAGSAQPFLLRTTGHLGSRTLRDTGLGTISVVASGSFGDTFASGARRTTTIRWRLTLRRVV